MVTQRTQVFTFKKVQIIKNLTIFDIFSPDINIMDILDAKLEV